MKKGDKQENYIAEGMSLGMCFGCGLGMLVGFLFNNPILGMTNGISLGMLFGLAIGSSIKKRK